MSGDPQRYKADGMTTLNVAVGAIRLPYPAHFPPSPSDFPPLADSRQRSSRYKVAGWDRSA